MLEKFEVEFEFMEKWGRFAKADYLQAYLYILYIWKKDEKMLSVSELAKKLDMDKDLAENAIDFWITAGVFQKKGRGYAFSDKVTSPPKDETSVKNEAKERFRARPSYVLPHGTDNQLPY